MYDSLTDTDLISSYHKAVHMQLDQDFIDMLLAEVERRNLPVNPEEAFISHASVNSDYLLPEE